MTGKGRKFCEHLPPPSYLDLQVSPICLFLNYTLYNKPVVISKALSWNLGRGLWKSPDLQPVSQEHWWSGTWDWD